MVKRIVIVVLELKVDRDESADELVEMVIDDIRDRPEMLTELANEAGSYDDGPDNWTSITDKLGDFVLTVRGTVVV